MEHGYAEVNGIRLHYAAGGQGKLLLFLHGFPEFWYAWKGQLAEFGKDYLAVAPDLRGYNLSDKPARVEEYETRQIVEDVRGLAAHFGAKKFCLVGHDWGGVIAWAFALAYPEALERLIIINAPHPAIFQRELRENAAQQKASQYMILFRTPMAELFLSANGYGALVESVLGPGLRQGYFTEEDRQAYLEAWAQPGALTGGLNYYRAAPLGANARQDTTAAASALGLATWTVKVPTLVIWGEQDTYLLTGNLTGMEELVPDLRVRRIPDGSHWVIHEKPGVVNGLIRDFVEGKP